MHPYLVLPKRALTTLLVEGNVAPAAADIVASAAAFATMLLLSGASYRLIEEPGRRAFNRAARAWTRRPAMQRS